MERCKVILVAVDFSDSSDNAFQLGLHMAKTFDAKLYVLHVLPETVEERGFYVPAMTFDDLEEKILRGAHEVMDKFCHDHLKDYGNYESMIVHGRACPQIIAQARAVNADMIVMGTHGRSGLDHVAFGSVAEKVVRKSPYPVLTVRLKDEEPKAL